MVSKEMKNVARKPIVYDDEEDDLEALRRAALSTIGKKKKYEGPRDKKRSSDNGPFFHPRNNPNLIAIVPVEEVKKDDTPDNNIKKVSKDQTVIAQPAPKKDVPESLPKPKIAFPQVNKPAVKSISTSKEVQKNIPIEVKKVLPNEVRKGLPNEVKKPPPTEVKKAAPNEVKKPPPIEVKKALPNEVKQVPPTEVKKIIPKEAKKTLEKVNESIAEGVVKSPSQEASGTQVKKSDISLDFDLEDKLDFEFEESDDDEMNFLSLGDDEDLSLDKLMDQMEQEFNSVKVKKKDKTKKVEASKKPVAPKKVETSKKLETSKKVETTKSSEGPKKSEEPKKTEAPRKEEKPKKEEKKDLLKEEEKENSKMLADSVLKEVQSKKEEKAEERKISTDSEVKITNVAKESPPRNVDKQSYSPHRKASPYRSPVRRRTPPRWLSPGPRRRSLSPRRRSLSPPPRRRGPSPYRDRSPWRWSPRRRSRSPPAYLRSPSYRRSRSPVPRLRYRSPYRRSLSPVYRRSRSPVYRRSRSPAFRRSRSPHYRRSPAGRRSFSPRDRSPLRRRSPVHYSPSRRRSPLSPRRRPLSPLRKRSPLSPRRSRPSPDSRSNIGNRIPWDNFSYDSVQDDRREDALYNRDSQKSMKERNPVRSGNEPIRESQVSSTSVASDSLMEARRRKFESKHPVSLTSKTVRLNRDAPVKSASYLETEFSVQSSVQTVVNTEESSDGKPSQSFLLSDDAVHAVKHLKKKSKEKKRSKKKKLSSPDYIVKKKKIPVKIETTSLDAPSIPVGDDLRAELSRRREKRRAAEEAGVEIIVLESPSPPKTKPMMSPPPRAEPNALAPRPVHTLLGASRLVQSALEGAVRSHTAAVKKAKSKLEEPSKPIKLKESKKKDGKIRRVKLVKSNPLKRKEEEEAMIVLSPSKRGIGGSIVPRSQV